jgi:prepilin-type N-terminal cleavage/methylation domain-containing protein
MHSRNSGFTLVELIVALTVMVMVTTVAFAGFRIGLNAWEKGMKAADKLERRTVVERLIRRQLPVAMPTMVFNGTADHLEFVSDYSLTDGSTDFLKVDYAFQGGQFLYGEKSILEYDRSVKAELPTTVLAKFNKVSFEFFGEKDGKTAWVSKIEGGVPEFVRVSLDGDTFVVRMVNRK